MIASWFWLSTREVGFFGPMRASESKSRHLHLAIVLGLTPYRSARTMSFSSLAWIARRILGVVVAQVWVPLLAARPRFRATRRSPIALRHFKAQQGLCVLTARPGRSFPAGSRKFLSGANGSNQLGWSGGRPVQVSEMEIENKY
jgi:hypothetical protein